MTLFRLGELRGVPVGGGTYNPFENPSTPLSAVALDSWFGSQNSTDAGVEVNTENSLAVPTVFRCVALLSGLVASCPLDVFVNPGKKNVTDTVPCLDPTNYQTTYTPFELKELIVVHLALWGNAYVRKIRDDGGRGRIVDLKPLNPANVKVDLDDDGYKIFKVKVAPGPDGQARYVPLTTFEVMHVPGMGYNGLTGLAPIEMARQAIGTAKAGDTLAARFYSRGTQLTGVINVKAPLSDQDQADAIRKRWIQKNSGIAHAAEVAVLDAETTFQPLTIPPEQLQFLASRRWQTTEIARIFGIPPHLIGDVEKSTSWGTGIEEQNTAFLAYTINGGYVCRIEERLTREVVVTPKAVAKFFLDQLLRGDMTERFQAYATAIQWGWMTRNEARLKEDMQVIEGLDEPLTPLNMVTGKVKIDPATGQATPVPGNDLDGPLTTNVKPGSGKGPASEEQL